MIAEITLGIEAIKVATGLLQVLNATSTEIQINEVKIGLQRALLEAQSGLFAAQQADAASLARIHDLERQIAEIEDWKAEKARYELKPVGPGASAYVLKAAMEGNQSGPWYCPNCFEGGKKSVYQKLPRGYSHAATNAPTTYECAACKLWSDIRPLNRR